MAELGNKIGEWDQSKLIKFLRDQLDQFPVQNFSHIAVENLVVNDKLIVEDRVIFTSKPSFVAVGGTGAAPFLNSWVSWGSPYHAAGYWRDPLGFVHLQGVIKTGTVGSSAFKLPPGYRPRWEVLLGCLSNGTIGRIDVQTDGDVIPQLPSNNTYVALDGVHFKAA